MKVILCVFIMLMLSSCASDKIELPDYVIPEFHMCSIGAMYVNSEVIDGKLYYFIPSTNVIYPNKDAKK